MGLGHSPKVVTDGLLLNFDAANAKSFKGVPATNVLTAINYGYGESNTSVFKITNSSENVYIPALKTYVTSKYIDVYNDYNGGSGACCLNLYSFGTSLAVSGSTTYTYSIIYKTRTGYTHPNYMYRYEYTSGDAYVTEAGVHNTGNRISLGDGWYYAWGQFTTQPTTAKLSTYLFHYEYATQNRVYVYKAAIYLGSTVLPVDQMLSPGEVRGATVATGGGLADLSGRGNHGELVNGPTYDANNRGSIVFDGSNDYITLGDVSALNFTSSGFSVEAWTYIPSTWTAGSQYPNLISKGATSGWDTNGWALFVFRNRGNGSQYSWGIGIRNGATVNTSERTGCASNTWLHLIATISGSSIILYENGTQVTSAAQTINPGSTTSAVYIGADVVSNCFPGRVSGCKIYNKVLSATEIAQNFNALRGRYSI